MSSAGIETNPEKVEAVVKWPEPLSIHDDRGFLGPYSYYRRFVKCFAEICGPFTCIDKQICTFRLDGSLQSCIRSTETGTDIITGVGNANR